MSQGQDLYPRIAFRYTDILIEDHELLILPDVQELGFQVGGPTVG